MGSNCDRPRFQALNGILYGAVVSPKQVDDEQYADVTEWLALSGDQAGQTLTTEQIGDLYPGYTETCLNPVLIQYSLTVFEGVTNPRLRIEVNGDIVVDVNENITGEITVEAGDEVLIAATSDNINALFVSDNGEEIYNVESSIGQANEYGVFTVLPGSNFLTEATISA